MLREKRKKPAQMLAFLILGEGTEFGISSPLSNFHKMPISSTCNAPPLSIPSIAQPSPFPTKTHDNGSTITYRHIDTSKKFIVNGLLKFMGDAKSPNRKGTALEDTFFDLYNRVIGPILVDRSVGMPPGPEMGQAKDAHKTQKSALTEHYKRGQLTSTEHAIPKSVLVGACPVGYKGNKNKLEIKGAIEKSGFVYHENKTNHMAHTGTRIYSPNGAVINAGKNMKEAERTTHEERRIEYGNSMRCLLTQEESVSAALQLQQLEYCHNARSQLSRSNRSGTADWLANKLADRSFYANLNGIQDIYFAPDNFWEADGNIVEIHALEVTDIDKIEAAIARLYVQKNGEITTVADVKEMLREKAFHIPATMASLSGDITEADKRAVFWSNAVMPDSAPS